MVSSYTLDDLIIKSCDAYLAEYEKNGHTFLHGRNGPHGNSESGVRNAAHWLISFSYAWKISQKEEYRALCDAALRYLMSDEVRPHNYTHMHRTDGGDRCNGVIGPAWAIEALVYAYNTFGAEDILRFAVRLFKMLPFDDKVGLWRRIEIDGTDTGFDLTLNHQLWFAAAGAGLCAHDAEIAKQIGVFLDMLDRKISLMRGGYYKMNVSGVSLIAKRYFYDALRTTGAAVRTRLTKGGAFMRMTIYGYHLFHTYALATLREAFPHHTAWNSDKIKKSVRLLFSEECLNHAMASKFGKHYNPPGFEIAFSVQMLGDLVAEHGAVEKRVNQCVQIQVESTYNHATGFMDRVDYDTVTYASRIYEAVYLRGATTIFPSSTL